MLTTIVWMDHCILSFAKLIAVKELKIIASHSLRLHSTLTQSPSTFSDNNGDMQFLFLSFEQQQQRKKYVILFRFMCSMWRTAFYKTITMFVEKKRLNFCAFSLVLAPFESHTPFRLQFLLSLALSLSALFFVPVLLVLFILFVCRFSYIHTQNMYQLCMAIEIFARFELNYKTWKCIKIMQISQTKPKWQRKIRQANDTKTFPVQQYPRWKSVCSVCLCIVLTLPRSVPLCMCLYIWYLMIFSRHAWQNSTY